MAHTSRSVRLSTLACLILTGLGVCALGGCYSEGGLPWSEDQHVFVSRPYQPWTVSLKDTRTGEEFWSTEVPVGKQLVVHFNSKAGAKGGYASDQMEWAIMEEGQNFGPLGNTIPVPPANSRRLEATLRPVPELPSNMGPNTSAAPTEQTGATGSGTENP